MVNILSFGLLWQHRTMIDFRAFYSAGRVALTAPHSLYDATSQRAVFPDATSWIPFNHLPHEALVCIPLSLLPYRASLTLWLSLSVVLAFVSCRLLSASPWLCYALFGTSFSLFEGQDTVLLLFGLSATLYLLERDRDILAGGVLALALFKPQVPLVVAIAMLTLGRRKFFAAFAAFGAALGIASLAFIGTTGVKQLVALMRYMEPNEQAWRMISLRGLLSLFGVPYAIVVVLSLIVVAAFVWRWRGCDDLRWVYGSAVTVGCLIAFHFHAYDSAFLLIPLSRVALRGWNLAAALCFCLSPLFFLLTVFNLTALLCIPLLVLVFEFLIRPRQEAAVA